MSKKLKFVKIFIKFTKRFKSLNDYYPEVIFCLILEEIEDLLFFYIPKHVFFS